MSTAKTPLPAPVTTTTMTTSGGNENVLLYILAIFLPPLAVFIKKRSVVDVLINVVLWFLFWIPAVLHAWWVIATTN